MKDLKDLKDEVFLDDVISTPENELAEQVVGSEVEIKTVQPIVETLPNTLDVKSARELAEMLSKSTIIPVNYQRRPENCFVAIEMASRTGLSPFVVMQNLYVIQGKPSWSGSAIAAMIKASPQFKDIELVYVGERGKDNWGAYVKATDAKSGKELKGGTVTIAVSKAEGWFQKPGSKWQTMPEIMLAYRAYAWFGRVFAPELMMGMQSSDEITDISDEVIPTKPINPFEGK